MDNVSLTILGAISAVVLGATLSFYASEDEELQGFGGWFLFSAGIFILLIIGSENILNHKPPVFVIIFLLLLSIALPLIIAAVMPVSTTAGVQVDDTKPAIQDIPKPPTQINETKLPIQDIPKPPTQDLSSMPIQRGKELSIEDIK